ncbi:MAG TPA: YCF48-related protein [Pyrinomonadaceae bacterium]|nr:YCF48-related protein [Pyrinomonadaceae bacterium]HMP66882.1 YCF48-related protein [Pyrinomonadaceae bacterium]
MKRRPTMHFRLALSLFGMWSLMICSIYPAAAFGNVIRDPKNFSTWAVVGPEGGDVRTVAIDPRDKDRLYISTLDGQIHVSADAGRSWRLLVNLEQPQLIIDDLLVDRRDSNVIYASGHRHKNAGGFFKSTDGGVTWKAAKELRNEPIHAMTQAESDPDQLFVGTVDGVWRSRDSGETWERIQSTSMPINVNSMAIDPKSTDIIYAGTWWRPYKSTDAGRSWRLIANGMIDDSDVFAMTVNPRDPSHVIASACSGIYQSFNGGERWNKIQGIPSTSRRTRDILQHPSRPETYYAATTEGFWMSVNAGRTWSMTTQRALEINSIAVHPDEPDRVFIGTNVHGVMVSEDGGRSFRQTNVNFTSRLAYTITPDLAREGRLYATTHNTASSGGYLYISNDYGNSWSLARGLETGHVAPFALIQDRVEPDRLFLATNRGIFRSLDRGASWTLLTAPRATARRPAPTRRMTPAQRRAAAAAAAKAAAEPKLIPALNEPVKVLAFTEDEKNGILAGTDGGLYRTYDITKGWEKLNFGGGLNENIFSVHASPQVPGTIWAGTATSGIVVSRDDGKTWEKVGGTPDNIPVVAITSDPARPNYIYAGTIQSFYLSRDGGRTWIRRGGNLPLGKYTSILINPDSPDEIFVGSSHVNEGGIYFSDDAGEQWRRVDSLEMGVPSRRVWSMAFDPGNPNRIFAASHSSGVYRIDRIQETAAKDKSGEGEGR